MAEPDHPVLRVDDLRVSFKVKRGRLGRSVQLQAVRDLSLSVDAGETLGLVGESGSGKSTTGRAILRLIEPDSGAVYLDGVDITTIGRRELRKTRQQMQMVFQDPYSSLDPSMTIADSIREPMRNYESISRRDSFDRSADLLERVGLEPHHLHRYPYEFSGGQRQRIAVARALALRPQLLVLDEAVSALDVSTQNQIIELLDELQDENQIAYLFIAHDLAVVRHLADHVAVMYLGEIVETGPTRRVYSSPAHPYTRSLLSAIPIPDPRRQQARERIILHGDIPDPLAPPSGCPFHTRCPEVMDVCHDVVPQMTTVEGGGTASCHLVSGATPVTIGAQQSSD